MNVRERLAVILVTVLLAPARGYAADVLLRGIVLDQRLDSDALPPDLPPVPTIVRLTLDEAAFTGPTADSRLGRLQELLGSYQTRHLQVVVALGRLPETDAEIELWRATVRTIVERSRGKVAAYQIGSAQGGSMPEMNRYV